MSPQPFLLDPKNRRVLEGKPRIFLKDVLLILFMVPFVLGAVGLVAYAIDVAHASRSFAESGVDVEAVVTSLWFEKHDDSRSFHVAYEYGLDAKDDRTHTGESTLDESAYQSLQKGNRIWI